MACKFCITNTVEYIENNGMTDEVGSVWTSYQGEIYKVQNDEEKELYMTRLISSNTGHVGATLIVGEGMIPISYCPFCGESLLPNNIEQSPFDFLEVYHAED